MSAHRHTLLIALALSAATPLISMAQSAATAAPSGQAAAAPDQHPGTLPPADEQALRAYRINDKTFKAMAAFISARKAAGIHYQDPKPADLQSLDTMSAAMLAQDPRLDDMLKAHGFTPRDYLIATIALLRADVSLKLPSAAEGSSPANIAFAKKHQAQIKTMYTDDADAAPAPARADHSSH